MKRCRKSGYIALLYTEKNVKSSHFLFLTSRESPLNKGGSEGVWKYSWLLVKRNESYGSERFYISSNLCGSTRKTL